MSISNSDVSFIAPERTPEGRIYISRLGRIARQRQRDADTRARLELAFKAAIAANLADDERRTLRDLGHMWVHCGWRTFADVDLDIPPEGPGRTYRPEPLASMCGSSAQMAVDL